MAYVLCRKKAAFSFSPRRFLGDGVCPLLITLFVLPKHTKHTTRARAGQPLSRIPPPHSFAFARVSLAFLSLAAAQSRMFVHDLTSPVGHYSSHLSKNPRSSRLPKNNRRMMLTSNSLLLTVTLLALAPTPCDAQQLL